MIGRTLGKYHVVEQIGIGGMATVYKAYNPDTDHYVALKVLPDYYSKDPTFQERFRREARAIARLQHIHILPVHDYGEQNGTSYLVMRLLETGTLSDRIKRGPLPLDEASRLLSQIASALDYAHTQGLIHRDIKPSNVLLDENNNAILTDFGVAKMVESVMSDLTGSGVIGTPAYMSPEQCRSEKNLSAASDIYSLGIVLYEMLTGRTPFQAETPWAIFNMQLYDPLPPPRSLRPELTDAMEAVIFKALAKEPNSRFLSCTAMANAFAQAVSEHMRHLQADAEADRVTVTPQSRPTQVAPDAISTRIVIQRRRVPILTVALVGIVAFILVAVGLIVTRPSVVIGIVGSGLGGAIRSLPTSNASLLAFLYGDPLTITGITPDGKYYRVDYNGQQGWINKVFIIEVQGDLSSVPVIEVILPTEMRLSPTPEPPTDVPTAAFTPTPSADDLVARGVQFAEQGDQDAAILAYTQAIELDPNYVDARIRRADVYSTQGNYDAALADYTTAIEINPGLAWGYNNRAYAYGAIGDWENAIADFTRAIEIDPNWTTDIFALRGDAYLQDGNTEAALADYRAYLEIVGDNPDPGVVQRVSELEAQLASPAGSVIGTVYGYGIAIRSLPIIGGERVGVVNQGEQLLITGISLNGRYYRVDYYGQVGWISKYSIREVQGNLSTVPVVNP